MTQDLELVSRALCRARRCLACFLRRFEREAKASLALSHENIVRAYGVGDDNGVPYIVLEYVEGKTLKDLIQESPGGHLSVQQAIGICSQILDALSYAHAHGIIHRDVKPQNVIVTNRGKAKLADFGIAREVTASTVTFSGKNVVGSVHYISPEQAKGLPVTEESDIYSTGISLYEMLTGTVPFIGDTTVATALMHLSETPTPPRELNPAVPPALNDIVPDSSRRAYDVRTVIGEIADPESFFELQPNYATNIVTGFGRIGGRSVGFICNQPMIMGGCLDINASDKASRFIQMCDAFGLPLINLVDVPGFLPGTNQEYGGIIRHGAKLLYVYSVAESPKITVIMRKAYGGSYLAMCSKDLGADMVLAWPTSEIAVMGAEGAANIIFAKDIKAAKDNAIAAGNDEAAAKAAAEAVRQEKIAEYTAQFATPYVAASHGYVDCVIEPAETRDYILDALELFENKKREGRVRGNMPL